MFMKPPLNYVPGLGRGATGFTTRSDIGPSRSITPTSGPYPSPYPGPVHGGGGDEEEEALRGFDEFEGNDVGIFAKGEYDEEDEEADAIYAAVDLRMDLRRKDRREERLKKEIRNRNCPKINVQFADLKRNMQCMSREDWDKIPEIGDYSRKKRKTFESFVPVPDNVLLGNSLTAVGGGRGAVLSVKLDGLSNSVRGLSMVDSRGYLSDLEVERRKNFSDGEISDVKKARLLLRSVIEANPKHPRGWIAAARLEEVAGRVGEARRLIKRGCEECPKSEDVWLEACWLASGEEVKGVVARGVRAIPDLVNLWLRAAEVERDEVNKSRVLRKGLEKVPGSVRLWKAVVELASEEDARLLLRRAVECCPLHVELWVSLAKLESYDDAKKVLNSAKKWLSKEPLVWIAAAKLEEANGNNDMVGKIIERGIRELRREGLDIDREVWMKEAEVAERAGSVVTCKAIISNTVGIGVEDEDRKRTWVADAEECRMRDSIQTARAIYEHALTVFLTKKSIWLKAVQLEKSHGTRDSVDAVLRRAVTYIPHAEVLWLMGAKEKWQAGDVPAARAILKEAYAAIPNSEEIYLAAFKLEFENHEPERARMLLAKARERGGTERVWMKSAIVERELGDTDEERKLLDEGLKQFPSFFKLWLMRGQLDERLNNLEQAKTTYESGLKHCPHCIQLWLSLHGLSRSRAVLTTARKKNPRNSELWFAGVRAELRHGFKKEADVMMAKALQECPNSGILWALSIQMAPCPQRKSKSFDAMKRCDNDPHVSAAVAKLFWQDRKVDTARKRFEETVTLAPENGDFWALYYKFELQHGTEDTQRDVLNSCVNAEPKYGEKWQSLSKAVENSHQDTESILKKVVLLIGKEESAAASSET